MAKLRFFEPEKTPEHIHIGMRTTKTVIAVFLCALIGIIRDMPPFFSMFSAVVCMQNSNESTLVSSMNRVLATFVGGFFAVFLVYFADWSGLLERTLLYYVVVSLALIPTILFTLLIKKPSITALACIVFISVTVANIDSAVPIADAFERLINTTIGVLTAIAVNAVLPNKKRRAKKPSEDKTRFNNPDAASPGAPNKAEVLPELGEGEAAESEEH